jgi:hypothetical protein
VTVQLPAVAGAVNKPAAVMVPHVVFHVTFAVAVNCSVAFTSTVGFVGAIESVDATATDPERDAVCGLVAALSVNTRLAVRVPEAEGVKVMVAEQLDPEIKVDPHDLLVIAKSEASAPVIAMLLIVIVDGPALLNVTDLGELVEPIAVFAKVTLVGATDTPPVLDAVAVPVSATCSAVPLAEILKVAARAPAAAGLKTTLIAQLPAPATLAPHVLLAITKSPAFAPERAAAPSVTADPLVLLSVTV